MSMNYKLVIHGMTDVGLVRDHNEDNIAWDASEGIVLLADGMGGHNAGEVASELAVNSIRDALADILHPEVRDNCDVDYEEALLEAITYANQQINEQARNKPECSGMGTTIVVSVYNCGEVILAHVGDSRIYRFRDNQLEQVTTDHSLVQEMVDNGFMSQEEAQTSMNRNLITRALGIAEQVEADVSSHPVREGDIYLYCSDGLSDMVNNEDIQNILQESNGDLQKTTRELIELANQRGGHDNISVILTLIESK